MKTHKQVNERLSIIQQRRMKETEKLVNIAVRVELEVTHTKQVNAIEKELRECEIEERTLLWFLAPGV